MSIGIRQKFRQALREPLVHFLLAGLAIFLFYGWIGTSVDEGDRRIVVDEAQVGRIASQWVASWRRAPTPQELDGLIRDYIKEEVYYREAIRLGLETDDPVVRRRMRSKMEFLANAEAESIQPDDKVLQAWLDKSPGRYGSGAAFDLDQIYVAGDRARAVMTLARLNAGTPPAGLGTPIDLPASLTHATLPDLTRQFGPDFADAVSALPIGTWSGPVPSGYGLHLVRVRSVVQPRKPVLADVRQKVENDWRDATRASREQKAYQTLLDGYDIVIAQPK